MNEPHQADWSYFENEDGTKRTECACGFVPKSFAEFDMHNFYNPPND